MNLRKAIGALSASALLLSLSAHAGATPQEQAMAEALFREAKTSFEKKDYGVACRKFEDSYRLDAAGGTQFALALCYEASGRVASAWVQFQAVIASKGARADRLETARSKMSALEAKLPRVVIDVPKEARVDGLEVRNDGTLLGASSWGTALPVDPGPHKLTTSAPGRTAREDTYEIAVGERRTVVVKPLELVPVTHAAPTEIASPPPPPPASSAPPTPPPESPSSAGSGQRTVALVAGGVGVVGVVIGAIFGLKARSKASSANATCPGATCSDAGALAAIDDGKSAAKVSNIAFVIGGVGIAGGLVLWLTAPSKESSTSLRLSPAIGARDAGLLLGGTFR